MTESYLNNLFQPVTDTTERGFEETVSKFDQNICTQFCFIFTASKGGPSYSYAKVKVLFCHRYRLDHRKV